MSRRHQLRGALAVLGVLASASLAHAQGTGTATAKVSAEALFEEGRRLMGDGNATDACPKFAESQRLDPSAGTLLNLASCYEKTARPATAWATYREGASAAAAAGRQDLRATAERHADALLPTLPRINITVATPSPGMAIALDGVAIGRAEWGVAVPLDPGEHSVDAVAPHAKTWSTTVTIANVATTAPVAVPALEPSPEEPSTPPPPTAAAPPAAPSPAPLPPPTSPPPDNSSSWSTQRTVGLVVGAVGVISLGVGAGFAIGAKSAYSGSLGDCLPSSPDQCSQAGVNQRNSAISSGNAATVAVSIGAVAVAGGLVLWLTAPTHSSGADRTARRAASPSPLASLGLVPTLGGGMLRATW